MGALLRVNLIDFSKSHILHNEDAKAIEDIITWRRDPTFLLPGRTAYYQLRHPIRTSTGVDLFYAKLKGVGAWNPEHVSKNSGIKGDYPIGLSHPSNIEYLDRAATAHFGVDDSGHFTVKNSEPAPFGAITVRRAIQEFENASILEKADVPTILPFSIYAYPDLPYFRDEPLGVVICLVPCRSPYPLDFLLWPPTQFDERYRQHGEWVSKWLMPEKLGSGASLGIRQTAAYRIGKTLAKMASAGLYRYSSGWDNFMLNEQSGEVILTDLDSSIAIDSLKPKIGGQQILRDIAGALFRIATRLYHPSMIGQSTLAELRREDLFAHLISGYFQISINDCQNIVRPIWVYFGVHFNILEKNKDIFNEWDNERRKSYKVDRDVFYAIAILVIYETYDANCNKLHLPKLESVETIRRKLSIFLKEKFELVNIIIPKDK